MERGATRTTELRQLQIELRISVRGAALTRVSRQPLFKLRKSALSYSIIQFLNPTNTALRILETSLPRIQESP